jgi:putative membrane protein
VLIVWLVRLSTQATQPGAGARHEDNASERALDILQARFARGELTKEEYLDMRSTLGR